MPISTPAAGHAGRVRSIVRAAVTISGIVGITLLLPLRAAAQSFTASDETELGEAIVAISADFARGNQSGPFTITLTGDVALTMSLPSIRTYGISSDPATVSINGNGHTIDANGTGRVFVIASGRVDIHNLRVRNAHARGGAGGRASNGGGGGGGLGAGAAIFVNAGAALKTTGVIVENAAADGGAGGAVNQEGLGWGGAGGGGLNGAGGRTEPDVLEANRGGGGGGGGGGYAGDGGCVDGFQALPGPDVNGGSGGGGELGNGGGARNQGGGGGGGHYWVSGGGQAWGQSGAGGGGARALADDAFHMAGSEGGYPEGGRGGDAFNPNTNGQAGLALGGAGGGAELRLGGHGGFLGGGGGAGRATLAGNGGTGGGGGGGGGGAIPASNGRGGDGGEFGGGGGGGMQGPGGIGGFGAGGGGGGGAYSLQSGVPGKGGDAGFGGGGGGQGKLDSSSGFTTTPGAGGSFGGDGGRGGGGGAALGGAIFVNTGGTLTVNGLELLGTFDVTPGAGGAALTPAERGGDGQARGRVLYLSGGAGAQPVTFDTGATALTIPGDDAIAGEGTIAVTGAARLTIEGDNSRFTGPISLTEGALRIGHDRALGSGPLTIDAGRLGAEGASAVAIDNDIMLDDRGLTVDTAQALTLGGDLDGFGPLIIDSPGQSVTLSDTSGFNGATVVNAGTLILAGFGPTASMTLNTGATLDVRQTFEPTFPIFSTNATFSSSLALIVRGPFYATGTITKTGAGSLTFAGSTSFGSTSVFTLNGGTVRGAPEQLPLDIVTATGTGVVVASSAASTYAGRISGDGGVSKNGPGTVTLSGPLSYTGPTSVNDGTLRLNIGGLSGNVALLENIELTDAAAGTFSGRTSGPGLVRKTGPGTLTITNTWNNTGQTTVMSGALQVDGTVTASNVFVTGGGTLAGRGEPRRVTMRGNSTLSPGPLDAQGVSGPGILETVAVSLDHTVTLAIDVNGPTAGVDYDRVIAANVLALDDAMLRVKTGFVPPPGATFVIGTNATGTFAGLPEGATVVATGGHRFRITYTAGDGNDVALIAEEAPAITGLIDRAIDEDTLLGPIAFTVADDISLADALLLTASSSNANVVRTESIAIGGTGSARTLTIAPVAEASGTTSITVRVEDESHFVTQQTFMLTVTPVNDAPTITAIPNQVTPEHVATSVLPFVVGDQETAADALVVSVTSSDAALVPPGSVTLGGSGASRTIRIAPAEDRSGTAIITVTVSDGEASRGTAFALLVIAAPDPPDPPDTPAPPPVYYLAEGATGAFFDMDLLIANPYTSEAPATIEFLRVDGISVVLQRTLAPLSRITIRVDEIPGLQSTTMSTRVTSTSGLPIVVERTMRWDAMGYGAHTEKATGGAAREWLFAEGAQGFFSTYLLLVNPEPTANVAHVTWLRENEPPLFRDYPLPPSSRVTIDPGEDAELVNRTFGAHVIFDQPGAAERAMYFGTSPFWSGGHAAAGVTAPATHWLLAEGATGSYFTTFVLVANPNDDAATLTFTYLPAEGPPVTSTKTLAGRQRLTINVAMEDESLASASVSTDIVSTLPVVVERAQYWPNPAWHEAHDSFGVTSAATTWALAEGRVGGPRGESTYILLANPGSQDAEVTVTFLRESGEPLVKTFHVPAARRFNVRLEGEGSDVPELIDEAFGARIDATQPIVVERSVYGTANGVVWAAGTNATATRLP